MPFMQVHCNGCKHVREHVASLLPYKVIESIADKPLRIGGVALAAGMSRNFKYSPFAEKAGMQKIVVQQSVESVSTVYRVLLDLGFDLQLLGSERYVKGKLENLNPAQLCKLKEAFIKNKQPRFKKEFAVSRHQPFGKTSDYVKCVQNADLSKIAKLVKLVGMLMQTKVYLFWQK